MDYAAILLCKSKSDLLCKLTAVASLTMIFAGIITLLLAPLLVPKLAGILHSIPTAFG